MEAMAHQGQQQQQPQKWAWEDKVVATVASVTADEAWSLLSDFLAFHVWHPRVAKCRRVSGVPLAPGCVRYCEGTPRDDGAPPDWANETLLEYDAARRFFRYEMNENNMGFGKFFATFRVSPCTRADLGDVAGCTLEWSFECEPVKGTAREALVARLQAGVDGMAGRVQEAVRCMRAAQSDGEAAPVNADLELKTLDSKIAV